MKPYHFLIALFTIALVVSAHFFGATRVLPIALMLLFLAMAFAIHVAVMRKFPENNGFESGIVIGVIAAILLVLGSVVFFLGSCGHDNWLGWAAGFDFHYPTSVGCLSVISAARGFGIASLVILAYEGLRKIK